MALASSLFAPNVFANNCTQKTSLLARWFGARPKVTYDQALSTLESSLPAGKFIAVNRSTNRSWHVFIRKDDQGVLVYVQPVLYHLLPVFHKSVLFRLRPDQKFKYKQRNGKISIKSAGISLSITREGSELARLQLVSRKEAVDLSDFFPFGFPLDERDLHSTEDR